MAEEHFVRDIEDLRIDENWQSYISPKQGVGILGDHIDEFVAIYDEHPKKDEIYQFVYERSDDYAECMLGEHVEGEDNEHRRNADYVASCYNSLDHDIKC